MKIIFHWRTFLPALQKIQILLEAIIKQEEEYSSNKSVEEEPVSPKIGWSNFCTLVVHFSKLIEFAGLNRLKALIFVSKSGCSLKKKGLQLKSISEIPIFVPKSGVL